MSIKVVRYLIYYRQGVFYLSNLEVINGSEYK